MSRAPEAKAAMQKLASSYSEEEILAMQQKVASTMKNLLIGSGLLGTGAVIGSAASSDDSPKESPYVSPAVAAALGVAAGYAGSKLPEHFGRPSTPGYGEFDFTPDDLNMIMSAAKPSRRVY